MSLSKADLNALYRLVTAGLTESSRTLSAMTTGGVRLTEPRLQMLSLAAVPFITGGPQEVVVAVYLGITGDVNGHLMLLFQQKSAGYVADMLLEVPHGTTGALDSIALSALGEVGNVCGSSFLNTLSDQTGLCIVPTAPVLVTDMAGAILESVVSELYVSGDDVLVIETGFNGEVPGHFVLMPDPDSMVRLVQSLEGIK